MQQRHTEEQEYASDPHKYTQEYAAEAQGYVADPHKNASKAQEYVTEANISILKGMQPRHKSM